jgi:hypothetical protein
MKDFFDRVQAEHEHQKRMGWQDEHNSAFAWIAYIAQCVTRFALDVEKYNFGTCMVKTAALCCAAYEWWMAQPVETDAESVTEAVQPSG